MKFKLVADSSCDLNDELHKNLNITLVPLTLQLGDKIYKDDATLDLPEFMTEMKECKVAPKTACPAPSDFMRAYEGPESVFVVTLTSALSGTYSSAVLGQKMFLEDVGDKFIHVFDSLSASIGETLVSMKIFELAQKNYENLQIVEKVNHYIKEMKTYFVLESLDNLVKAGRLNNIKGMLASLLSIKPIMRGTEKGEIEMVEKIRGSKNAIRRLLEVIGEQGERLDEKILGIAHCNCLEKALKFKEEVMQRYKFKDIVIVNTGGLSSVYANDGGIIIAF